MSNERPTVSIVVPIYNVEEYLPRCLDSIANQTFTDIEIICVDDGSPDNSIDILHEYKSRDSRIRIIQQENMGLSGARNTGIKHAIGEYIMFVDSDDYIDLDTVDEMYKRAIEGDLDAVICGVASFNENGYSTESMSNLNEKEILTGYEYLKKDYRFASCCNKLFKLSKIRKEALFFPEGKLYEDLLFVFKYMMTSKKIGVVKKYFYHYMVKREGSITNTINQRDIEDVFFMVESMIHFLEKEGLGHIKETLVFQEYIVFWISRSTIFKLANVDRAIYKQKLINYWVDAVKYNAIYYKMAKYVIAHTKNRRKKIIMQSLYISNRLCLFLIRFNDYRHRIKRR